MGEQIGNCDTGFAEGGDDIGALVCENLPFMQHRARQLCRGHVDADDVVQDAVVRAFEIAHQLRDRRNARAWLRRIVFSTFIDALRRQRRRQAVTLEVDPPDVPTEDPGLPPWAELSADDVRCALARLSEEVRTTYQMFELEGRSYGEIATTLTIPKGTVGTRVLRARRQLRMLLAAVADLGSSRG